MSNAPDFDYDPLRLAVLRLARRARLERADGDITGAQLSVIFVLARQGVQTLRDLSEWERVTPPSMSRTVNSLIAAGLASRKSSPDDGRKVLVELTAAGAALANATKRRRAAWFARQVNALSTAERATLLAAGPIMQKLADS